MHILSNSKEQNNNLSKLFHLTFEYKLKQFFIKKGKISRQ